MVTKRQSMQIRPVGGNASADVELNGPVASGQRTGTARCADSRRAMIDTLFDALASWVEEHALSPDQVAECWGTTPTRVRDVLNRDAAKFTVDALVTLVLQTGKRIEVVVQEPHPT